MRQKTKKTSTDKPGATNNCDCSTAVMFTLGALGVLAFLGCLVKACVSTPTPEEGACYQHREETMTVARVNEVVDHVYDVEVKYEIESADYGGLYHEEKSRFKGEFNDLYKKLDSCDRYWLRAIQRQNAELSKELDDLKASRHK